MRGKIIFHFLAALYINFGCFMISDAFGLEIMKCSSRLDTEEGYFGYILNKKEHAIIVEVRNEAKAQLIHSAKVHPNGHTKMRLASGLYLVDVINPSGCMEHFTLYINLVELINQEGPWVVEIEEYGCE